MHNENINKPKIIAIVQARTTSTRLNRKVLLPLGEKNVLLTQIERIQKSKLIDNIIVATSTQSEDDIIEKICLREKINVFRGDLYNLLDRHYQCAKVYNADIVLKIPSDCPLISPSIIDKVISKFLELYPHIDYVSNLHPPTYPDGNDVEVMSFNALEIAWKEAKKDFELEHTTPYIWENPDKFKLANVEWETGWNYSKSIRLTLDYLEDYILIKTIFEELYFTKPDFELNDIINLLKAKPYYCEINEKYLGEYWYKNHYNDLKTIKDYYPEYY